MFDRVLAGCDALPVDKRQEIVSLEQLRSQTAAARASHERISSLRIALKSEITNRKALFLAARRSASNTALGLALNVNFQPSEMLAAGLDLAKPTARASARPPRRRIFAARRPAMSARLGSVEADGAPVHFRD